MAPGGGGDAGRVSAALELEVGLGVTSTLGRLVLALELAADCGGLREATVGAFDWGGWVGLDGAVIEGLVP